MEMRSNPEVIANPKYFFERFWTLQFDQYTFWCMSSSIGWKIDISIGSRICFLAICTTKMVINLLLRPLGNLGSGSLWMNYMNREQR
jgi:hypothetical protein